MRHRKGRSSLSRTFAATLFTAVCIGCVSGIDGDALFPLFKLYVKKMRTFMDSYHPEIGFAKCAISTFPLYELFPEALKEFHPDYNEESLQPISSRSSNDSDDQPNTIPYQDESKSDVSSYTEAPLPTSQALSLNSSTEYTYSSTASPSTSNQFSTSEFVSSSSMPPSFVTTPLPFLATYPPLPPINHQNNSLLLSPPTTFSDISNSSSLSVSPETSNPPIPAISTPTSPLPSYFLFQALTTSGFSSEDSIFIIELLELFFPDVFTSSVAEIIVAWQERDNPKMRQNDNINIADAWLEGLDAVLESIFGARPHVKRETLRNLVPTLQWKSMVPLENDFPISRVGEDGEGDEENVMSDWWASVRSTGARLYHRLRMWVLPDAERGHLGGTEAKLVGLAHCARGYVVDIIWRWGEEEAEELRREVEEKKRQNVFRPKASPVQALPPLLKLLMPS